MLPWMARNACCLGSPLSSVLSSLSPLSSPLLSPLLSSLLCALWCGGCCGSGCLFWPRRLRSSLLLVPCAPSLVLVSLFLRACLVVPSLPACSSSPLSSSPLSSSPHCSWLFLPASCLHYAPMLYACGMYACRMLQRCVSYAAAVCLRHCSFIRDTPMSKCDLHFDVRALVLQ
jgi:hypothetical protein